MELYGYADQFANHATRDDGVPWSPDPPGAGHRIDHPGDVASMRSPVVSLIYDGTSHLDKIEFWAAYLVDIHRFAEVVVGALGMSLSDARSARDVLLQQPQAWPAFTVPLPRGGQILIVARTHTETELSSTGEWIPSVPECGTDFWLADADPGVLLAEISGHQWGPGLSWPELRALAGAGAPDRMAIAHRLLLLVPALGDTDAGEDAVAWVAQALTLVAGRDAPGVGGARARRASRAAAEIVVQEHVFFLPATWRADSGVRVCDGAVSVRNPQGHRPLPVGQMRRVSDALQYG